MEIWEKIQGFENYEVSSLGKVRNKKGSIMSSGVSNGYHKVGLYNSDKKRKNLCIHRLVASAFILNTFNKPEVNHINGIKADNRVENLEWNTSKENSIHAYNSGLSKPINGSQNGRSKLSEEQVLEIRTKYSSKKISQRELSKLYNVSQCLINNIVNTVNWKHL